MPYFMGLKNFKIFLAAFGTSYYHQNFGFFSSISWGAPGKI